MSGERLVMPGRDFISNLPDEILGRILSWLPTHRAATTTVLSKRWRNLFGLVDNLDLNEAFGGLRPGFCDFVNNSLALLTNSPALKSFSLNFRFHYDKKYPLNTWIRTALERGCLKLHLNSIGLRRVGTELFTGNTLVELSLARGFFPDHHLPRGAVLFPALKTLSITRIDFEVDQVYEDFISPGCPVLEDLLIDYPCVEDIPLWNGVVSSPSIKRLTIIYNAPDYPEAHNRCRIHTPSLVYLDYSSYVAAEYEVDFASLVEARLNLESWEHLRYGNNHAHTDDDDAHTDDDIDYVYTVDDDDFVWDIDQRVLGDVTGLLQGISNVKTLHLSAESLEVLYLRCESMPVFRNLRTLSFESDKKRDWAALPLLLDNSPSLETLVIKGLVHQVTNICGDACACTPIKEECCLLACQVKVLRISEFQGTCREMKQMRHFLANLKCLETVKVGVQVNHQKDKDIDNKYHRITDTLMKLPRVSSQCQIHFF